jgi:hypothetical protein
LIDGSRWPGRCALRPVDEEDEDEDEDDTPEVVEAPELQSRRDTNVVRVKELATLAVVSVTTAEPER